MKTAKESPQAGFTIIELLIATVIFSFILLIATSGIIKIGQLYYKGVTESKTQETARNISDELSRAIQFADGIKTDVIPGKKYCLGDTRYTVNINKKYVSPSVATDVGLIAERIGVGANCVTSPVTAPEQLLGSEMRLLKLEVVRLGTGDNAWSVNVRTAYGDDDLLSHYDNNGSPIPAAIVATATCKSGIPGGSFCATAQLDTVVKKRLN